MNEFMSCSNVYEKIIQDNPLLSREEEVRLAKIVIKSKGDKQRQQAREKLFNSNVRLVLKEVVHYQNHSQVPWEDLVQAGNEGLCIAIDRFNPRKFHTKLSTYAVPWIRLKIFRTMESANSMVYVPPYIISQGRKYRAAIKEKDADRSLPDSELMKILDVTERELRNIRLAQNPVLSLNDTRYVDDDSGHETTLQDFIEDTKSENPASVLYDKQRKELVQTCLRELTDVQRDILISRYIKDEKEGLKVIGKKYGLTGERIRQIERTARRRLKFKIEQRTSFKGV